MPYKEIVILSEEKNLVNKQTPAVIYPVGAGLRPALLKEIQTEPQRAQHPRTQRSSAEDLSLLRLQREFGGQGLSDGELEGCPPASLNSPS